MLRFIQVAVALVCLSVVSAQFQPFPPQYQPQYQIPSYQPVVPQQQQFQYPYQQQQQFSQLSQQPYVPGGAYGGNNLVSAYGYSYGYPNFVNPGQIQNINQQQYYPAAGYVGSPVVTGVVPVREGPEFVAATPVVPVTPVVEAPEGGHYEIYEYGRDELDRQEILPVPGSRMKRPFNVNIRKPHYEIYKWGRSGFY